VLAGAEVRVRRRVQATVLGTAAALIAAVTVWNLWPQPPDVELIDALTAQQECDDGGGGGCAGPEYQSLDEVLANVRFDGPAPGQVQGPFSDAVVVGRFVDVQPGPGYRPSRSGGEDGMVPVAADDPTAWHRAADGRFAVESVVSGRGTDEPLLVRFSAESQDGDSPWRQELPGYDVVADGLPALGRVLLVLDERAEADEPEAAHRLVGGLLAPIDDSGRLGLPLLPEDTEAQFLRRTPTLDDLRDIAAEPLRVIELNSIGERVG
jgi:hypothetical protein